MMDWEAIGVGGACIVAVIGGNAFVMKLIIDNAVTKLHLLVAEKYVTKEEFEKHIEHCPHAKRS
jgi:hypothetical protein